MRPVWAFAFSTASSGATLPVTLTTVERRLGVHNSVAGFTIPLGATINMDGTAIMQGVATVFIAQVYGNRPYRYRPDDGYPHRYTCLNRHRGGTRGRSDHPDLVLEQAGLPVEGIALILG